MKKIRTSIQKNKKFIEFLIFFFLLGVLLGVFFYYKVDNTEVLDEIKNISKYINQKSISFLGNHFFILMTLIACSCFGFGLILFPLVFIYEGITISYYILSFLTVYQLKGFIYSILSLIILKGIYLLILSILFKTIFQLLKQVLNYLKNENQNIKNIFIIYGKRIFLLSFILIINDIFIKLWGSNILNILIEIIN